MVVWLSTMAGESENPSLNSHSDEIFNFSSLNLLHYPCFKQITFLSLSHSLSISFFNSPASNKSVVVFFNNLTLMQQNINSCTRLPWKDILCFLNETDFSIPNSRREIRFVSERVNELDGEKRGREYSYCAWVGWEIWVSLNLLLVGGGYGRFHSHLNSNMKSPLFIVRRLGTPLLTLQCSHSVTHD